MLDDSEDEDDEIQMPRVSLFDRIRTNYFLNGSMFREAFRVDREVVVELEQHLGWYLQVSRRNNALDARQQILTTLHFLGNGAQYHVNGHMHTVSKSTVCRCVHRVCRLIATNLMPLFVRWPTTSRIVEAEFFNKAGFPHVKGVIDGTLIHIDAPSSDEPLFVSRDNKHSLNVLLASGPRNQFFFVSAKCTGSFHDSRALRVSRLWTSWEIDGWRPDNDRNSILLGDSAYPLRSWLMPPIVRDINANNRRLAQAVPIFLRAHRRTRFIVECSIGILKKEFPFLSQSRFRTPERTCLAVYACVTLHNIQNHWRHGSYAYDDVLNQIANQRAPDDQGRQPIARRQQTDDGIQKQREVLEYFARNLNVR